MARKKSDNSGSEKKKTKTVSWSCVLGCNAVNIRVISFDGIINDDICDHCRKVYHEPVTSLVKDGSS